MKKLLTVLLTSVMAIGLVVLNNNYTKAEESNANYEYKFKHNNGVTTWTPSSTEPSYNKGDKTKFTNIDDEGTHEAIQIFINDSLIPITVEDYDDSYEYTFENNGGTVLLNTSDNIVYIVDTAPPVPPTPTPSSKKDESCEKVIGPSWHWNNDKGICEEYATVGTSTR